MPPYADLDALADPDVSEHPEVPVDTDAGPAGEGS